MTIELPVFRLGVAGFSAEQSDRLGAALAGAAPGPLAWEIRTLAEADAWWVNGSRVQLLADHTLRVPPGFPTERALQLHLPDIDRPVAFSTPVACAEITPAYTFDAESVPSMAMALEKFEAWLSPLAAQFSLASHIVEGEVALGRGVFEVILDGQMLAVVDMHGETGLLPGTSPMDFEDAEWRRRDPSAGIPENFLRTSLSLLMWQYCTRTRRDLLPRHYRTSPLYFRRPPRVPHRVMRDSHLLIMRELARGPATLEGLRQRTSLPALQLARDLAALYFVGSITSNPKRAAPGWAMRRQEDVEGDTGGNSSLPSGLDSSLPADAGRAMPPSDLTAPAPMGPR